MDNLPEIAKQCEELVARLRAEIEGIQPLATCVAKWLEAGQEMLGILKEKHESMTEMVARWNEITEALRQHGVPDAADWWKHGGDDS